MSLIEFNQLGSTESPPAFPKLRPNRAPKKQNNADLDPEHQTVIPLGHLLTVHVLSYPGQSALSCATRKDRKSPESYFCALPPNPVLFHTS